MAKGDFLGEFELYVLLAIGHCSEASYGLRLRHDIEARTGREVAIGSIYATLARLEDKGLIRHEVSAPTPVPGGRSRKHYQLTPAGERALAHSTQMLRRMMLGGPTPRATRVRGER
jgi:PadR family transcriptional regulator PadR